MGITFTKPQAAGDVVPAGVVVLWPSSSAVPSGWALCDGTNGTQDFRGYYPRGTPSGDTVNRTYGAATHTHTAAHSHTGSSAAHKHTNTAHTHGGSGLAHCHDQPAHTHTGPLHCHAGGSHTHVVGAHCHGIDPHTHPIDVHEHGTSSVETPLLTHSVDTVNVCTSGGDCAVICGIQDHGCDYVSGTVDSCDLSANSCGTPATDSAGPFTSAACNTFNTDTAGTGNTGSGGDDLTCVAGGAGCTDSGGGDDTGETAASVTVAACTPTTSAGSTLPPTRNTNYIMKL